MIPNMMQPSLVQVLRVTKAYTDFSTAGLTLTINLATLPAFSRVIALSCQCTTAPAGGALATYTVEAGDAGDPNGYEAGADHIAGGVAMYETHGAYLTTAGRTVTAATAVQATATSTGANLNAATQGAWTFRIAYVTYNY